MPAVPMVGWGVVDGYVRAHGLAQRPRSLGQTIGGGHVNGSRHYLGLAVDYGLNDSEADAIAQLLLPLATGPDAPIVELYGSDGTSMKNGGPLSPEPAGHRGNHTHASIRAGVTSLAGYTPSPAPAPSSSSSSSSAGLAGLAMIGRPSTWLRLVEVVIGGGLILMGLIALQAVIAHRVPTPGAGPPKVSPT